MVDFESFLVLLIISRSGKSYVAQTLFQITEEAVIQPCTLKNAKEGLLDGTKFCFAHLGRKAYKNGAAECKALKATLPLPKTLQENSDLIAIVKQFGVNKLSNRNGIILDTTDVVQEGSVFNSTVASFSF